MNQDKSSPPAQPSPKGAGPMTPRKIIAIVILTILVLVAAVFVLQPQPETTNPTKSVTESPESGLQTETELGDFKHEVTVVITSKGPSPQTLRIPNDTRINWMNKDKVSHRLAITPGTFVPDKFDNNHKIEPAGGYPYVIHKDGIFHYYLVDKPKQGGTVIIKN